MWQYIAFYENGCYTVREYYKDIDSYTVDPIEPCGETYEELIKDLEHMLEDVKRGVEVPKKLYTQEDIDKAIQDTHDLYPDGEKYYPVSQLQKLNRVEVIDETGRAYVKGDIYGLPVEVELSYQDDGQTLKIFVKAKDVNNDTAARLQELRYIARELYNDDGVGSIEALDAYVADRIKERGENK